MLESETWRVANLSLTPHNSCLPHKYHENIIIVNKLKPLFETRLRDDPASKFSTPSPRWGLDSKCKMIIKVHWWYLKINRSLTFSPLLACSMHLNMRGGVQTGSRIHDEFKNNSKLMIFWDWQSIPAKELRVCNWELFNKRLRIRKERDWGRVRRVENI